MTQPLQPEMGRTFRRQARRRWHRRWRALTPLMLSIAAMGPSSLWAQTAPNSTTTRPPLALKAPPFERPGLGRSGLPLADPIVDADALISARKVSTWTQGQSNLLLLEGDVSVTVGTYGFRGDRAFVRIDPEQSTGRLIRHFSIYLDNAKPLRGRGPVTAEAPRLLVTASTTGQVQLKADALVEQSAEGDPLVVAGQQRIDRYLDSLQSPTLALPPGGPLFGPDVEALRTARRQQITQEAMARAVQLPPEPATQPAAATLAEAQAQRQQISDQNRLLPAQGQVGFHADSIVFDEGDQRDSYVLLVGNVQVMYQDPSANTVLTLTAESVVIFLAPESMEKVAATRKIDASDVRGVYLEDNVVATDGQYTIRAPRIYYDLVSNKALVLDAVFYTYDVKHNVPIYVRAEKLQQESRRSWSAQKALVTTSEFAEPHFSIAANRVNFRQLQDSSGDTISQFTARDMKVRVGNTPIFYWPKMSGQATDTPIRDIEVRYSKQDGPIVTTTWDLFALSGRTAPEGVDLTGNVDYLGQHGPATGINLDYDLPRMYGFLDSYLVPLDHGDDEIGSRNDVDHDGDVRGNILWRHRHYLADNWEMSIEGAYVSDPTFLEEFFRSEAEAGKEHETSLYLKKQEEDWAFTFLTKYNVMDFTPQTWQLQAPGYTVDKLPELGYFREATSLWDDRLTWYSENRLSRMRIRGGGDSPADRGFDDRMSALLFNIPVATTDFEDDLDAADVPLDYRHRVDTRQELQAPLKIGMFDAVPYVAGRITGYDDDFNEYSGEDDNFRLWGTVGTRFHTQVSRSYDRVESGMLDLHRLRHIVEPSLDLFYAGASIEPEELPIYDYDVEGITEGAGAKLGLRNTLQTQRGGPGQWRSVDWLVVNTDLIVRSDDSDFDREIPRYYSYRPEYSVGGDHFFSDVMWQVTDTLALVGEQTYDLENNDVPWYRVGGNMRHTPQLSTFIDYTEIQVDDGEAPANERLLGYGFTYELTRKYSMGFRHTLDMDRGNSREVELTLERKLPRWRLLFLATHDEIDNEQSFGIVLIPQGVKSSRDIRPFGR